MIITWTILNNEIDYLADIIDYHSSWVDKMYFLDTGSDDGSWEFLQSEASDKIIVERYHTLYQTEYSKDWHEMSAPFPEVEVRNYAIKQAEKLGDRDSWLIQLDGDEVFLSKTKEIIQANPFANVISHSTINPVCPLSEHPMEKRRGLTVYDPHARIWKAGRGYNYIKNPAFHGAQYHCIPVAPKKSRGGESFDKGTKVHLYGEPGNTWTDQIIHFHLHWMYGNKVDQYFNKKGISNREEIVKTQTVNQFATSLPGKFWQARTKWING